MLKFEKQTGPQAKLRLGGVFFIVMGGFFLYTAAGTATYEGKAAGLLMLLGGLAFVAYGAARLLGYDMKMPDPEAPNAPIERWHGIVPLGVGLLSFWGAGHAYENSAFYGDMLLAVGVGAMIIALVIFSGRKMPW